MIVGGPVWTTGKFGGALQFDGEDDLARIPDEPAMTFTAADRYAPAAWIYIPEVPAGWPCVICKGRQICSKVRIFPLTYHSLVVQCA